MGRTPPSHCCTCQQLFTYHSASAALCLWESQKKPATCGAASTYSSFSPVQVCTEQAHVLSYYMAASCACLLSMRGSDWQDKRDEICDEGNVKVQGEAVSC